MAYDVDELEKLALKAIEKHKLWTYEQVSGFVPCSKTTLFKYKLNEMDSIKNALRKSRATEFTAAFQRMKANESATAQIAICKVLGEADVRDALNGVNRAVSDDKEQTEFDVVDGLHDDED